MTDTPKVFESEYRFCQVLWEVEPINSTKLVKICKERLGWSKATTYTVIRRLSERGVVQNVDTIVSTLVSQREVQVSEIDQLLERAFNGSMPAFVAAFASHAKLSREDAEILRRMIDEYEEK